MTREEFNTKYPFLKKLEAEDLKELIIFILTSMLETALLGKKEQKLEIFINDCTNVTK